MFRWHKYLEKTEFSRVNLDTPITLPGNNQTQSKTGYTFTVRNRDVVYDWFNAYFRVEYQLQNSANGAFVAADTQSAPVNSSFSLIKALTVKSARKTLYQPSNIHKVIFIKNLVEYSDDFAGSVAKDEFWYLDTDATNVTASAATNKGIRARALLSQGDPIKTVQTVTPLNRFSFFEGLSGRLLPPMEVIFEVILQDDAEVIYQHDGTARRIVVTKFELWIPRLELSRLKGKKMVYEEFLQTNHVDLHEGDVDPHWGPERCGRTGA